MSIQTEVLLKEFVSAQQILAKRYDDVKEVVRKEGSVLHIYGITCHCHLEQKFETVEGAAKSLCKAFGASEVVFHNVGSSERIRVVKIDRGRCRRPKYCGLYVEVRGLARWVFSDQEEAASGKEET